MIASDSHCHFRFRFNATHVHFKQYVCDDDGRGNGGGGGSSSVFCSGCYVLQLQKPHKFRYAYVHLSVHIGRVASLFSYPSIFLSSIILSLCFCLSQIQLCYNNDWFLALSVSVWFPFFCFTSLLLPYMYKYVLVDGIHCEEMEHM